MIARAVLRMVGAEIITVNDGAEPGQFRIQMPVQTADRGFVIIPPGNAGLIGDHDDEETRIVQKPYRLGRSGDELELRGPVQKLPFNVNCAVTVEKDGTSLHHENLIKY
jgi:hypothetical protein